MGEGGGRKKDRQVVYQLVEGGRIRGGADESQICQYRRGSSSSQGKRAMDDPEYALWKKLKAAETGMIVQERVEGLDSGKQISLNGKQRPGGARGHQKYSR